MRHIIKKISSVVLTIAVLLFSGFIGEAANIVMDADLDLSKVLKEGLAETISMKPLPIAKMSTNICDFGLIKGDCRVSSNYGLRKHPVRRRRHFHSGVDLAAAKGTIIYAPADGVISFNGRNRGYGKMVDIDHGFSWKTRYAHLSKTFVKNGEFVKRGQKIAAVGSTGVSTGPHLHFEIRHLQDTVDPVRYFTALKMLTVPSLTFANR